MTRQHKKILFICGSLNQTSQMFAISKFFPEYEHYFTPYYLGDWRDGLSTNLLKNIVIGGKYRARTLDFLVKNNCRIDDKGIGHDYDVVLTCSDIIIQRNIKNKPIFVVQEGMTDPERLRYWLVKKLHFPRYIAGTSVNGLSNAYEIFFVASEGYRDLFIRKGAQPDKLCVTGIPNFDFADQYRENDFPHSHYVLAATSNLRECGEFENRKEFILRARKIAGDRQLFFKLHPSEHVERASREIRTWAPNARIYAEGDTNHMIANCDVLITRQSSVVYIALALGKEVYADLPLEELRRLLPIQNGGASAQKIAAKTKKFLEEKYPDFCDYHNSFHHPILSIEEQHYA